MLLKTGETGRRLNLSRHYVLRLVEQGHLKPFDTLSDGEIVFKPEEVERVRKLRLKYPPRRGQTWNPPKV